MPKIFEQRLTFLDGDLFLGSGCSPRVVFYFGAAAQFGGGLLADRFPMKWLVAGALFLQLPICWLAAHAAGWPMFAIAVLMAVFTLGLQPVVDSLVAHYVPPAWHARAFGMRFLAGIVTSSAASAGGRLDPCGHRRLRLAVRRPRRHRRPRRRGRQPAADRGTGRCRRKPAPLSCPIC